MSDTVNELDKTIGSITMGAYISFSILFFIVCLFNDWDITIYIITFWLLSFGIQFSMNLSNTNKVCGSYNSGTAFIYTLFPWCLILGLVSIILWLMPGWVRIFSNTIGLAVSKSIYYELFNITNSAPDQSQLTRQIYSDPSKLINEVEYRNGYTVWIKEIYIPK